MVVIDISNKDINFDVYIYCITDNKHINIKRVRQFLSKQNNRAILADNYYFFYSKILPTIALFMKK